MKKITRILLSFVLPFCFILTIIISYSIFKKLVFPADPTDAAEISFKENISKIRKELLKRKDLLPINFLTQDGLKLSAYLIKRSSPRATLVVCHGYRDCKEMYADLIDLFPEFNILLFDFRAHGKSEGQFRTLGCHEYKDVIAAVEFLKKGYIAGSFYPTHLPVIIIGFSMGGACAIKALEQSPDLSDLLIIDSSFADLKTAVHKAFSSYAGLPKYPFLPIIEKMVNLFADCSISRLSPETYVKNIKQPILFIHSCQDNVVAPYNSILMYANSTNEKTKLWIGPKCTHAVLRKHFSAKYKSKVLKFFRSMYC